jgi:hypothetical protein
MLAWPEVSQPPLICGSDKVRKRRTLGAGFSTKLYVVPTYMRRCDQGEQLAIAELFLRAQAVGLTLREGNVITVL